MSVPGENLDGFLPGARADLPATGSGVLDGLRFAVKDLIDLEGHPTGGGNPQWQATQSPAAGSAPAVDALRRAGAHCVGKTITDEFAFSLEGRNHYYATPRNPRDPRALPGGSSSGSAVAVAIGAVDFALGTDTGGSVRVPAAWCGVFGFRPTHGALSTEGVLLFARSLDTIGWFARDAGVLAKVGQVLMPSQQFQPLNQVHLVEDSLDFLAPEDATSFRTAAAMAISAPLLKLFEVWPLPLLQQTYSTIQAYEIAQEILPQLDARKIALAPEIGARFEGTRLITGAHYRDALAVRRRITAWMTDHCPPGTALALPTVSHGALDLAVEGPTLAQFYMRTLGLNAVAGLWGAPQIQFPRTPSGGLGLSLLAAPGADHALLDLANSFRDGPSEA